MKEKITEDMMRQKEAGSRLSESEQRNKEEKERGKIKVTPVSVTEEFGRGEGKELN